MVTRVCVSGEGDNARTCRAHEAGYDSFMTGSCLIYLAHLMHRNALLQNASVSATVAIAEGGHGGDKSSNKKSPVIAVASFEAYEVTRYSLLINRRVTGAVVCRRC